MIRNGVAKKGFIKPLKGINHPGVTCLFCHMNRFFLLKLTKRVFIFPDNRKKNGFSTSRPGLWVKWQMHHEMPGTFRVRVIKIQSCCKQTNLWHFSLVLSCNVFIILSIGQKMLFYLTTTFSFSTCTKGWGMFSGLKAWPSGQIESTVLSRNPLPERKSVFCLW